MIKVEMIKKKGTISFYFESRGSTEADIEELDELYAAILGSNPRRGGYEGSNRFQIEVRIPEEDGTDIQAAGYSKS